MKNWLNDLFTTTTPTCSKCKRKATLKTTNGALLCRWCHNKEVKEFNDYLNQPLGEFEEE